MRYAAQQKFVAQLVSLRQVVILRPIRAKELGTVNLANTHFPACITLLPSVSCASVGNGTVKFLRLRGPSINHTLETNTQSFGAAFSLCLRWELVGLIFVLC